MRTTIALSTAFVLLASCSLFVAAPEAPSAALQFAAPGGETAPRTAFAVRDPAYPLDVCVVSGRRPGDTAVTFAVGGHSVTTCCGKCQAEVESHPEPYLAQISAAALTAQLGNYPLTVCPVSGDVLGESGEPTSIFVRGVLVRLCGDGCLADARANADTIVETVLAAAFAQQQKTYPLDTCIVSGRPLGKTPVATMVGTTLVKFCCPECAHRFDENADAYLPRLATALCERTSPARIDHHATTCCVTGKQLGADAVTFTVGTETKDEARRR